MSVGYVLLLGRLIHTRKKFWSKPRRAQKVSAGIYILVGSAPVAIPTAIWFLVSLF